MDQKFIKNFTSLVFSNFFVQGLRFLTIILLARNLEQEIFGIYNYILLLVGLSAILVEFGLKNYGIREFAQGRGSWNLAKNIIQIRLLVSALSIFLTMAFCYQAFRRTDLLLPTFVFSLSLFVDGFLVDFVSIAEERLHLQAVAQTAQALIYLVTVFLIIKAGSHLLAIASVFTLSHIVWVAVYYLKSKTLFTEGVSASKKAIIKSSIPFLISIFVATVFVQLDIFLLGQFHYDFLLGDYSACLKLLAIPLGIVGSFVSSVQPRLARISHDRTELLKTLKHYVKFILVFIVLMVAACWTLGPWIIHLFFGTKFQVAPFYFGPLSLVTAMFMITLLPSYALYVSTDTKTLLRISFINFILGAVVVSAVLFIKKPEWLPWGMLFVQSINATQVWRHYLKK